MNRKKQGDFYVGWKLDNLLAHLDEDVKKIFVDGHVILTYFVSKTAE